MIIFSLATWPSCMRSLTTKWRSHRHSNVVSYAFPQPPGQTWSLRLNTCMYACIRIWWQHLVHHMNMKQTDMHARKHVWMHVHRFEIDPRHEFILNVFSSNLLMLDRFLLILHQVWKLSNACFSLASIEWPGKTCQRHARSTWNQNHMNAKLTPCMHDLHTNTNLHPYTQFTTES